jgi:tetratricopeptide (TPR) repeat protein
MSLRFQGISARPPAAIFLNPDNQVTNLDGLRGPPIHSKLLNAVKKETLITIVVFLGVGFLGGYAYNAHKNSVLSEKIAARAATADSAPGQTPATPVAGSADAAGVSLPEGHPPVNAAEIIRFLEKAAAQRSRDPEPRLKLANFLYDQQRWAEAIPWYRRSLRLDPRNVDARTDMATCYFNMGQFSEAIQELDEALKADPRHEATLFNLIVVNLEGTHNLAAAEQAWQRLDAINPVYPHLEQLKQSLDAEIAATSRQASK